MERLKQFLWSLLRDDEFVTVYPSYGFQDGNLWKIPVRAWVHEPRPLAQEFVALLADTIGGAGDDELKILAERIIDVVADSESLEDVRFRFNNDPEEREWRIVSVEGGTPRSDLNGIIEGFLALDKERAAQLLRAQKSRNGWLDFTAISRDHSGTGRVRLIEPTGTSVVSDIDDTIKVTNIPAGGRTVVRNTFFRPFRAVREMAERYRGLGNVPFHYVSGAPWQLYRSLESFRRGKGFPDGSFHMKFVPKNLLSLRTWQHLLKLVGDATLEQKTKQISEILRCFPGREFIFVGDSGEHDPEVYGRLRHEFGKQVREIWIRDVTGESGRSPDRFEGMTIIPG